MRFPAEIDNIKTLKSGMKITIAIDDDNVKEVLQHIYNFIDKPLEVDLNINADERQKELNQISPDQRKKIYAVLRDIGQAAGYDTDSIKQNMKNKFCYDNKYEMFSLSNCSKELASDFIEFLIEFAFENGVGLSEHPKDMVDTDALMAIALRNKTCCICGQLAEVHHIDTIGMGNDRNKLDDSDKRKISLCRAHHTEAHKSGWTKFKNKYHVEGIIYNE